MKAFWERGPITPNTPPMSGMMMSATSASFQEIENIITMTPTTVRIEVSAPDSDCWRVLVTLSTSLVTRESISPRCIWSK